MQRHIWQGALDTVENIRKAELAKKIYAMRKQTIERIFGDAKEKYAMRYTQYRGLARVAAWVRLKFATMNLKKLATWAEGSSCFSCVFFVFPTFAQRTSAFAF